MKLKQAFEVVRGDVVAFVGAGGKTSALIGLGYELADTSWRVLATTTTYLDEEQLQLIPHAVRVQSAPHIISQALSEHGFVFLYDTIRHGKVYGASIEQTKTLLDTVDSDVLLVEADGADGLDFKAPYAHEPTIPKEASLVIPVASLSILNKPLDEDHVYNPQAMIDKYGFYHGSGVRSPWIAQVLRDEELGLRGIPEKARVTVFINQTPGDGYLRGRARLIAQLTLKTPRIHSVALGSVRAADPVCEVQRAVGAIVLAGGQASRMGQPKQLLPWADGKTIIEHITTQLIRARIGQINVVTGYYADQVKRVVKPLGVQIAHNRAHRTGDMLSSLKAGLRAMPDHVAATLVVLGDQPRIQPHIIYKVLMAYAEGKGDIIAPSFNMRRGHPILIDRKYWSEFLDLRNDKSPRDVINAHNDDIHYINVDTDSVLRDIDTPADYEDERLRAGLRRIDPHYRQQSDAS